MGTNTENGIQIFGTTIQMFILEDHAYVSSGDRFPVQATDISGYWLTLTAHDQFEVQKA